VVAVPEDQVRQIVALRAFGIGTRGRCRQQPRAHNQERAHFS
jgi:hypothetical protein